MIAQRLHVELARELAMPKKSASKLIKLLNFANSEDWEGLLDELLQGSDRSCAILGGVFLDEYLQRLIGGFLIDDKEVSDGLFGIEKPLSTFSSRIKIAYALGLICKETYRDLNRIRNIRNVFAHTMHGLDFSHEDIKEWCNELELPKMIIPKHIDIFESRTIFICGILFTATYIDAKIAQTSNERRQIPSDAMLTDNWNPFFHQEAISETLDLLEDETDLPTLI